MTVHTLRKDKSCKGSHWHQGGVWELPDRSWGNQFDTTKNSHM